MLTWRLLVVPYAASYMLMIYKKYCPYFHKNMIYLSLSYIYIYTHSSTTPSNKLTPLSPNNAPVSPDPLSNALPHGMNSCQAPLQRCTSSTCAKHSSTIPQCHLHFGKQPA